MNETTYVMTLDALDEGEATFVWTSLSGDGAQVRLTLPRQQWELVAGRASVLTTRLS